MEDNVNAALAAGAAPDHDAGLARERGVSAGAPPNTPPNGVPQPPTATGRAALGTARLGPTLIERGRLSERAVRGTVARAIDDVTACYRRYRTLPSRLQTRLVIQLDLGEAGAVRDAVLAGGTARLYSAAHCIETAARGWRFPPAPRGGAQITQTFTFE